jgi:hypothetical protein
VFRTLTKLALKWDRWLHQRFGRVYGIALSVGLISDIIHRVLDAPAHVKERHHLIGVILAVAMEAGLLIHQIGEMHERLGNQAGERR